MAQPEKPATRPFLLWAAILAGPAAWTLAEGLSYSLDQHACSTGHFYVLRIISACCIVLSLSGAGLAAHQVIRVGNNAHDDGGRPVDRNGFLAQLGLALSLGFTLAILALTIPHLVLSPCD